MHDYLQFLGKVVSVAYTDSNKLDNTRVGTVRIITGAVLKLEVFDDEKYLQIYIPNIKKIKCKRLKTVT